MKKILLYLILILIFITSVNATGNATTGTTFEPTYSNVTYIVGSETLTFDSIITGDYCVNITGGNFPGDYCILSATPINYILGSNITVYANITNIEFISNSSNSYSNTTYCYQETANASTLCGGLNTGSYSSSVNIDNASALYDGDYDTFSYDSLAFSTSYLYINYTIPENIINVTWQYKSDAINTDKYHCYDGSSWVGNVALVNTDNISVDSSCLTGDTLQVRVTLPNPREFYEEGVYWLIGTPFYDNKIYSNENVYGICEYNAYDSVVNSLDFYWYVNSIDVSSQAIIINETVQLLPSNNYNISDNINLTCVLTFDTTNSTTQSIQTTVLERGIVLYNVSIYGGYPENNVSGYCNFSSGNVNVTYSWYIDDVLFSTANLTNQVSNLVQVNDLDSSNINRNEEIKLECTGFKNGNYTETLNSSILTITNHGMINFSIVDDASATTEVGDFITINGTIETYDNLSNCTIYLTASSDPGYHESFLMSNENLLSSYVNLTFEISTYYSGARSNVSYFVMCFDESGNSAYTENNFTVYDSTNPLITMDTETQSYFNNDTALDGIYNTEINLNVTFSDAFLFQSLINVTCDKYGDLFIDNKLDHNVTSYNFNGTINVEGLEYQRCQIILSVSDDHTINEIPDYEIEELDNSIKYVTENDANVEIISNDNTNKVNTKKYTDRYNFEFEYSDNDLIRSYTIKSDKEIFFRDNSIYPAHFVVWDYSTSTGNWIDFALDNSDEFTYIINKISKYEYDVFIVHNTIMSDITEYKNKETNKTEKIKIDKKENYNKNNKPNFIADIFTNDIVEVSKNNKPNMLKIHESKINKNELKQLLNLQQGDSKHGIEFVRFNSIGGTNIVTESAIFYIGGVINMTSNDKNRNITIDEYNLSITYNSVTTTYSYNTSENRLENLLEGIYTLEFSSEEYINQTYEINLTSNYEVCNQYLPNETSCIGSFNNGNIEYVPGDYTNPENMLDQNISSYADVVSLSYTNIYINYTIPDNVSKANFILYLDDVSNPINITFNVSDKDILALNISVRQGSDSDDILIQEIDYSLNGWNSYTNIKNGLISGASGHVTYSYLDYNNESYLFYGSSLGNVITYTWNGTYWIFDKLMTNIGTYSASSAFEYEGDYYVIVGESDGTFNGFIFNGTNLTTDSGIVNGLGDVGAMSFPEVFKYNGELYLISTEYDEVINGFKWNGTGWDSYSNIVSGLTVPNVHAKCTIFNYDNELYSIFSSYLGGTTNALATYKWNGYTWNIDTTIYDGISSVSSGTLSPESFKMNGERYLLLSYNPTFIYGYKINYSSELINISYSEITNYDSKIYEQNIEWLTKEPNIEYVTYNSSNTEITFQYKNIRTDSLITEFTIYVNDTENGTITQYNITGGSITLPLKANVSYNIVFEKSGFINQTFSYTFEYLDQYTITEYVSYTLNVNIIDEDTLEPFEFNGAEKLEILVICEDESYKYVINETNTTIPVNCAYDRLKAAVDYNVSVSADYYRIYIGDYEENDTLTIYLIDVLDTDYIYTNFILDDLLAKYINPSIWVKKKVDNETVVIHSDYIDIENKISTFLIKNDEYIIEVHSDNNPIQIIGRYGADYGQEKVISLYDVNLAVDFTGFYEDIYYTMEIINDSGNKTVQFSYEDLTNNTASVQFRIYKNKLHGTLIYESPLYLDTSSIPSLLYDTGIYSNDTLIPEIEIVHNDYGSKNVSKIINANWLINDLPDTIGEEFLSWFLLLFLSVMAIYSAYTTSWASLALVGISALFVMFNWISIGMGVVVIALIVSILDMFFKRGRK